MRAKRAALVSLSVVLAAVFGASSVEAQVGLRVEDLSRSTVRVDGSVREWRGVRFAQVGDGNDASMRYALGFDRNGLYVAAQVADERIVRQARPGPENDCVVLTLAMRAGRGYRGHELAFFPGVAGRTAAAATIGPIGRAGRPIRGAQVVEGPRSGGPGYELEAFVPWRSIPGGNDWQRGRGAISLRDVDSEARPVVESEPGSADVEPTALERLPELMATGGERAVLQSFLQGRGLEGTQPRFDLRGDVAGDNQRERVVVVGRSVVVFGPGYKDGSGFDFLDLPVQGAADVREASLRDLTGDGKAELALTLRQRNDRGSRDLWQVLAFDGQRVRPIFGVELRKETGGGHVEAELSVSRARRGPPTIEVSAGRAQGLDASTLEESPAADVESILLPWGTVLARTYRWDGSTFARVSERANPRPAPPPASTSADRNGREASVPVETSAAEPSLDEVIAAARRERGVPASVRPRFDIRADVAEDRRPERILVLGSALLVVGPGFREGRGYLFYELPASGDDGVAAVRADDITGDGKAEILVKVRQQLGEVQRTVLLVHQLTSSGFPRILAVEVGRQQDRNRIENAIRIVGSGRSRGLEIDPGRAQGWAASSWPFADGTNDGVEPLLLPWRDRTVRYRFAGGRLVR